jgi:hypothetical protein
MRPFSAIGAAFLIACALPVTSRADNPPATTGSSAAMATSAAPGCRCPRPHRVLRRHVRHHVRHWRHRRHQRVAVAPPPPYNPLLPSQLDSAYDRAMTLHFRNKAVTGVRIAEPGYPPTPPVAGIMAYRVPAYGGVYQYDGLTGQYIALAVYDARRSGVPIVPMAPPPPPPVRGERG